MEGRRKFRREGEERRRHDLIEATLDCVAERGLEGATVRAIALRAGVTAGLIRHYFPGKQELLQAAYAIIVGRMTEHAKAAVDMEQADPRQRLAAFVRASLGPPVVGARNFSLWAGFVGRAHADPTLAAAHREGYLGFREEAEALIAEVLAGSGRTQARPSCAVTQSPSTQSSTGSGSKVAWRPTCSTIGSSPRSESILSRSCLD
jgi:TetR/AcrR family transcriptional regulator, transcriptional repressor of bet genes